MPCSSQRRRTWRRYSSDVDAHAGGALHARLEDDRRDLVGRGAESPVERLEGARVGLDRLRGGATCTQSNRMPGERPAEHLDPAEARGAHGLAVEGALERDEARRFGCAVLRRELHGELDRDLDRGRPVVAEEHALEPGRRDLRTSSSASSAASGWVMPASEQWQSASA